MRRDKWCAKVQKVNEYLKELCNKYNFFLIDNCKFIKICHLNKSGISETKLDNSVPIGQFHIEGFGTPIRLNRNQNGCGTTLLSREGIPIKLLFSDIAPIESFYVEINLRKKKGLLNCSHNSNKSKISLHAVRKFCYIRRF